MRKSNTWIILSRLYMKKFGIPSDVFSVMCARSVLLLCVSGLSNSSIASFLEINKKTVDSYIQTVFKFEGWKNDLNHSPLYFFKKNKSLTEFEKNICEKYINLYSKIERYYQ